MALTGLAAPHPAQAIVASATESDWATYRQRFISPTGRVIDTGNGGVSHSEGQGYGMLLAVAHNDRQTFDQLLQWTTSTLRRRTDNLHSWRYLPNAANKVPDPNNATDGDLMIALALARAGQLWHRPEHTEAAAAIGRDVLRLLVRQAGPHTVLLPGAYGFERPGGLVVNLSYYLFPALSALEGLVPSPLWARLRQDGLRLIADARFGRWGLPPDWLFISAVDGGMAPAPGWPPRFSYDAIRVPLNMAWAGLADPALASSMADFWSSHRPAAPAWVDLNTNETARYSVNVGQQAVALLIARASHDQIFPDLSQATDYYAASLLLLAKLAWQEHRIA